MRQRNMMTGLDMEQHSQSFVLPPLNTVSSFQPYDNISMFYGLPQSHHQLPGPAMSTPPPNFYLPFHERDAHVTWGHGYKRKTTQAMPGNFQYLSTAAEAAPSFFSFPQPIIIDQRSVRNRAGAATNGHNNFIQGSYNPAHHPFPPPASSIWYDQHFNSNASDHGSSSSLWPSVPYMHGDFVAASIDSGSVCFPRYHERSSSRNHTPFLLPRHNHFIRHPPPPPPHLPPTVYPHLASASYTVPLTIHDASYTHVGPAATLRHHGRPQFRAFPTDEVAVFREGGFYYEAVDYHQDMRLDIEDMSYEELLALSDHIGTVKTGLSEEDVERLLNRRTSLSTRINLEEAPSNDLETDTCTICQENYKNQDKIATLDCRHEYHADCLKKWLVIKNICPVCKSEALVMEKKKE